MSGPQRIGKYEIQAVVSKGEGVTVCRGLDATAKREVALKFVNRAGASAAAIARLQQQAPTIARLRHPAIAQLFEVLEAGPAICIVSEPIGGKPLAVLQKGAKPDVRRAWDIARQLLDALGAAHSKGVTHGDVQPANIFLDAHARIRISGIGAWGLVNDAGALPLYAAPEHLGLGDIGTRSDLYQAGVVIYELVTGVLPFTGTRDEVVHRLMQERPADPSSHMGVTCWQLDWVIQRALSKDPNDRFATAAEFVEALRKGLEEALGEPLTTAPVGVAAIKAEAPEAEAAKLEVPKAAAPKIETPRPEARKSEAPKVQAPRPAPPKAETAPAKPALVASAPKPAAPAATRPIPSSQAAATLVQKARAAATPQSAAAAPALAAAADRRVRILFVDDEERILAGLRSIFRQEYNVFISDTPEDALELVRKHDIQIIVSDQRMPAMTGVELLRQVKEQAPQVVRILLTGYSDLAALVGSVNQGEVFRFVRKPWDNDELRGVIADAAKIVGELTDVQAPPPESPRSAGSVLVVDPQQGLARGLQRLLAGKATVRLAATALEAVKLLEKEEIACIVADLDAGREHLISLFKLLKQQRPEILSILVTDEPDSELVIDLINNAQIFRFVTKPVNARELRAHVGSALRRHATFKKIPTLVDQLGGAREAISA